MERVERGSVNLAHNAIESDTTGRRKRNWGRMRGDEEGWMKASAIDRKETEDILDAAQRERVRQKGDDFLQRRLNDASESGRNGGD